jgi:GntR family transcriptional regulator, transcriptional repressor for pyruvate dehydrogenase complex
MATIKSERPRGMLVQETAERLRDLICEQEPDTLIGSLPELARALGVGIVTVQQAARILEHEGLLQVRRGPGGGYYGTRPDAAALERSLAAYMRTQPASLDDALDITSLLFTELAAAAAGCRDESLRASLRSLAERLDGCKGERQLGDFETEFQDLLFRMVDRPLFELLTRVTLQLAGTRAGESLFAGRERARRWQDGRHRIIDAILAQDAELARFEADRSNRRVVLERLGSGSAERAA